MKAKLYLAYTLKMLMWIIPISLVIFGVPWIAWKTGSDAPTSYWEVFLYANLIWVILAGVFGIAMLWDHIYGWVNRTIKMNRTTYTRRDRCN